ncbi:tRNA (guanosine(37)-N1)-methyltransferase TrmD [Gammaproteobacteria bacterium]|jgi:tRNA (guanine37-N1)-methyltransferase|nr:tRNA (guanosine(37)-N1)-methyltransferase TrmD [Gammaproteobacteria bacterium]MBT7522970.1 tRNA (guanosine(37)-N1)-methyltransferase TrmD [Gammaproteobacteria bacterium]MBT7814610.1 tRNA (guanosine(37)-N1)-methyltransferase TrmD [Gammaproteobacteria bacterium]MDA9896369.1 tRNA (guanosine(37)-N1)-methyltransferase TrmD [Gammaproteobacteria bacterium]
MSNEIRQICVISVFPEIVNDFIQYGVLKRGQDKSLINIESINLRDFSDKNGYVDDKPYGGGAGMVLQAQPLIDATRYAKSKIKNSKCIYLSPKGKKVDQELITDTANNDNLIIIAGRYEGVDQRFIDLEIDEEWSIGDYILSGGEVAACVLIDAIARMIPGVLGHEDSNKDESFSNGYLEYPHYTRPEIVENISAPDVLLSGNHEEIRKWREKQALLVTNDKRSDLIKKKLS